MMMFMPQSPRHLMNTGREEECLTTLARLRGTSEDDLLVRIEHLEIKSLYLFEKEVAAEKYPNYQDGSFSSRFKIGFYDYLSLVTNKSLFKRTATAVCLWFDMGKPWLLLIIF
jgi:NDP-sugar pyrophosphorylase family protein